MKTQSQVVASMSNAVRHIVPKYLQISYIEQVVNISGIAIEYTSNRGKGKLQTIYVTDREMAAIDAADKRIGYSKALGRC